MEPPGLIDRIALAQENREGILNQLLQEFLPLNKKYASMLRYEDALSDMQLDFIKLIRNFKVDSFYHREDKYVLGYITKSVYHAYLKHSKSYYDYQKHNCTFSDLSDEDQNLIDKLSFTYDNYSEVELQEIKKFLTEPQFKLIYHLYFLNQSVEETGQALGISRQAVNKAKNKTLAKLRSVWL